MNNPIILIWAIPNWLMLKLMAPLLPKTHPWKDKHFSLRDWAYGRTKLTKTLDLIDWCVFLAIIFMVSQI